MSKGIVKWFNPDKGFGFIKAESNATEYFFHISAFETKTIRPEIGLEVSFEKALDDKARKQAINIFAKNVSTPIGSKMKSFIASSVFLIGVGVATLLDYLPLIFLYLYLLMSGITFIFYAWDKSSAKKAKSRIAEATLHYLSLFGGWPGALMAQQFLRHKSVKKSFRMLFWITVLLNISSLIYLLSPYGNWILKNISQLTTLS